MSKPSNPDTKAVAVPPKTPIAIGRRGAVFATVEDMYRFGECVCRSGLAPKGLDRPEAIVVAIEYGMEIGLQPIQALQNIAVVNGRPTIYGDAMLAVCMASGVFDHRVFDEHFEGDGEERKAVCTVGRVGREKPVTREFSVEAAKRAKLWGKPGPWTDYPDRMLQMRARSWALRDAFPDLLRGAVATEELLGAEPLAAGAGNDALAARLSESGVATTTETADAGEAAAIAAGMEATP